VDVDAGGAHYFQVPGLLQRHGTVDQTYYALYLVVGILLPLAVLAYSNFFLIRAVRNSRRMRRQFHTYRRRLLLLLQTSKKTYKNVKVPNGVYLEEERLFECVRVWFL